MTVLQYTPAELISVGEYNLTVHVKTRLPFEKEMALVLTKGNMVVKVNLQTLPPSIKGKRHISVVPGAATGHLDLPKEFDKKPRDVMMTL